MSEQGHGSVPGQDEEDVKMAVTVVVPDVAEKVGAVLDVRLFPLSEQL
jgi:hypothetical protein